MDGPPRGRPPQKNGATRVSTATAVPLVAPCPPSGRTRSPALMARRPTSVALGVSGGRRSTTPSRCQTRKTAGMGGLAFIVKTATAVLEVAPPPPGRAKRHRLEPNGRRPAPAGSTLIDAEERWGVGAPSQRLRSTPTVPPAFGPPTSMKAGRR